MKVHLFESYERMEWWSSLKDGRRYLKKMVNILFNKTKRKNVFIFLLIKQKHFWHHIVWMYPFTIIIPVFESDWLGLSGNSGEDWAYSR